MDIHPDVVNWLRNMGYNGEIPDNLINICNNSTKSIWEQLIQYVRPKQEVEMIKRNIILNRLKTKPLCKQGGFGYKVKEIETYKQKLDAEQKLRVLKEMVQDKQDKVTQMAQSSKMKDIYIDQLKERIKENDQRKYLLEAKREQLILQNLQAEETTTKLKNITPIEREKGNTATEITEILEKCAEKLNQHVLENQKLRAHKLYKPAPTCTVVKNKNPHDQSSVGNYFSTLENENFEEIARSCKKCRSEHKENENSNVEQVDHTNAKKRILIMIEDVEKSSFKQLGVKPFDDSSTIESSPLTAQPKKRESLGLLPASCLDEISNNDSFLCGIGGADSLFTDIPEQNSRKTLTKMPDIFKPDLYYNTVNSELKTLLLGSNRELIYEMLQKCIQKVKMEFTEILSMEKEENGRQNEIKEHSIAQLRLIHLQTELKIVEQKKVLKSLVTKIVQRKMHILNSIKSDKNRIALQDWLELSIKQVAIDATLAAVKKEINDSNNDQNEDNNCLQVMLSKIRKIKNDIANAIKLSQMTIGDLFDFQKHIAAMNESVLSSLWHVRMLGTDMDWMNPLLENIWSEEINVFNKFSLEYQRKCIYTEPERFYRDLCVDNYPQKSNMSQEDLQLLSEVLDSPFNPPETVLWGIMKAKLKLNVLKSLSKSPGPLSLECAKTYTFEKLQEQESYIEIALDRLKSLMFSSKALTVGEIVKQAMDVYADMPIKGVISDKRLFNGQNYQFYQRMLDKFL